MESRVDKQLTQTSAVTTAWHRWTFQKNSTTGAFITFEKSVMVQTKKPETMKTRTTRWKLNPVRSSRPMSTARRWILR